MTYPLGSRVVRHLSGRDWPGVTVGTVWDTGDGPRVRVRYDAGSEIDTPLTDLRIEDLPCPAPTPS